MGTDSSTDCHILGGHSLQELGQSHTGICWLKKQPQENLTSWPSPLDNTSHPHNSYLSSRVAISTTTSKLVPSVLLFSYFFIQFFSLVYFLTLTSLWIFIFTPLFYTHFIQLQCSALFLFPAFCTGLCLLLLSCLSMHYKSEPCRFMQTSCSFYLKRFCFSLKRTCHLRAGELGSSKLLAYSQTGTTWHSLHIYGIFGLYIVASLL